MVILLLNEVGEKVLCHIEERPDAVSQQEPQVPSKVGHVAVEVVGVVLAPHLVSPIGVEHGHGYP